MKLDISSIIRSTGLCSNSDSVEIARVLEFALSEFVRDSERLNFLQSNPQLRLNCSKGRWSLMSFTNYEYEVFKTVREAIDSASNLASQETQANKREGN